MQKKPCFIGKYRQRRKGATLRNMRAKGRRIPRGRAEEAPEVKPQDWKRKVSRLVKKRIKEIEDQDCRPSDREDLYRDLMHSLLMSVVSEVGTAQTRDLVDGFVAKCISALARNQEVQ